MSHLRAKLPLLLSLDQPTRTLIFSEMSDHDAALAEARELLARATQPRVRDALAALASQLESEARQRAVHAPPSQQQRGAEPAGAPGRVSETITTYSWDESDSEVKVYVKLPQRAAAADCEGALVHVRACDESRSLTIRFELTLARGAGVEPYVAALALHPLKHGVGDIDCRAELRRPPAGGAFATCDAAGGAAGAFVVLHGAGAPPGEARCRVKVKPSGDAVIGLAKLNASRWADLLDTDDFGKPLRLVPGGEPAAARPAAPAGSGASAAGAAAPAPRSRDDPEVQRTASLVSLMQQLYRDGDDEMKRTIAAAWEESKHM